jgi:hypothetical protein
MDIPQEVRSRVAKVHDIPIEKIDALIAAAQLPIAPMSKYESVVFTRDYHRALGGIPSLGVGGSNIYAFNRLIESRRNSPPQVDPLIMKIIEGAKDGGVTLDAGIAWYIAAAVRQECS